MDYKNLNGKSIEQLMNLLMSGKSVLDLGCAGTNIGGLKFMKKHSEINSLASYVVGVDLCKEAIEKMRRHFADVVLGDACSVDLGRTFDVVFAGELIEHVDNPGLLIENVKRHMGEDGIFFLTTPNADALRFLYDKKMCPDHVLIYNKQLLEQFLWRHFSHVHVGYTYLKDAKRAKVERALTLWRKPLYTSLFAICRK